VAGLRADGMSTRAIASALGVGQTQVRRDLAEVSRDGSPATVTGTDGKQHPASRPAPKPTPDLGPDVVRALTSAGAAGMTAWQVAFLLDSRSPDEDAVRQALFRLCDAGKALVIGQAEGGALWALTELVDTEPAPQSSETPEEKPADVPTATTDPVAAVAAALDQHVPDPEAPKRAWQRELCVRLEPISKLTLWLDVDQAAQFADETDVETLRQLALSFADLHRRVVAARTATVTPLRRIK
jgi:hypothetical protein